jgi:hypothetical protein
LRNQFNWITDNTLKQNVENVAFGIGILFGGLAVIIGFLGILTACCNKKCCTCCYSIWATIIFIVFLIFGIVFLFFGVGTQKVITDFCNNGSVAGYKIGNITQTLDTLDTDQRNTTGMYMCTQSYCPCPSNTNFNLWTETQVRVFNRTLSNLAFQANGTTYTPMYKTPVASVLAYSTFWECYQNISQLPGFDQNYAISTSMADLIQSIEE